MKKNLEGWRTIIASGMVTIVGILSALGVPMPGDFADEVTGATMAVLGVFFTVMRIITKTPVGGSK